MKEKLIAWTVNSPRQSIGLAMVLSLILASGIFFLHIEDDIMKSKSVIPPPVGASFKTARELDTTIAFTRPSKWITRPCHPPDVVVRSNVGAGF